MIQMAPKTKKTEKPKKAEEKKQGDRNMAKIKYERTNTATTEHELTLALLEDNGKGKMVKKPIVQGLPMSIVMKDGDEIEITQGQLDTMIKWGIVRSKEQMKEREEIIKNRTPTYQMTDYQRRLVLSDAPYEV